MKKALNKFALALWAAAVLVFGGAVGQTYTLVSTMRELAASSDTLYIVGHGVWRMLDTIVLAPVQLVALGVIIEMLDQIRWNAQQRPKQ